MAFLAATAGAATVAAAAIAMDEDDDDDVAVAADAVLDEEDEGKGAPAAVEYTGVCIMPDEQRNVRLMRPVLAFASGFNACK